VLRSRVLTAAVGLPAIILAILLGPAPFAIFLAVVSAGCTVELAGLFSAERRGPASLVATLWAAALATRFLTSLGDAPGLLITLPLVVLLLLLLPAGARRQPFSSWSWSIAAAFYAGWLVGHWGGLYTLESGVSLVLFGLLTTFGYDTTAYFAGRALGRHKLAPSLSSGKTWEGVAGGFLGAVAIALGAYLLLPHVLGPLPFGMAATALAAVLIAVTAQVGDLVESALKRSAGVKDAGRLLPGHGGMLDRFDSVLLTGTVLYYVSLWLTA
jgi:phosphatidate cytidylyltransferase